MPEDQDVGSKVIEVRAKDKDTEASITTYSINSGDPGKAFSIEEQTGFIRVAKPLDYEGIKEYKLVVGAWDGQFGSDTEVNITILNVNDMRPQFAKGQLISECFLISSIFQKKNEKFDKIQLQNLKSGQINKGTFS